MTPNCRGGGHLSSPIGFLAAIAALALIGILALGAGPAKAEKVGFTFDSGVINLGGPSGTWAKLPDPTVGDPAVTINTEVAADGALTAAKEDFLFPPKRLEGFETGEGALPVVDATIDIKADGPLTGSFDADTGDGSIVLPANVLITVYNHGSPASVAKCRISGFSLTLATTGSISDPGDAAADPPREAAIYDAAPFAPPSGKGATIAPWTSLPSAVVESGSLASIVCPKLDDLLGGPGAIWFSGKAGGEIVIPAPEKAPKLTGTPATSTEQTTAEFKFEAGEGETSPVTGFECKLDTGAFAACDSGTQSYSDLAVGSHTFTVRAKNQTGTGPETPFNWTVTEAKVCPEGTTGTPPNCIRPPNGKAKLGNLKIQPKKKAVKRGKKAVIKIKVKNVGKAKATGVKVCVNAPKKLVKVKKCVNLGQVAAGKAKTAKFKVKAKRKRGKAVLKFKATSKNAGKKNGRAVVRVK